MRRKATLCSLILATLAVTLSNSPAVRADDLYASIRGTVVDPTGAAVPDVTLTAVNLATGIAHSVTTDKNGAFSFIQLPVGDYNVTATKAGFKTFTSTSIHLEVNQVYILPVQMQLGEVTEKVVVEANPAQVETTTPQLGTVVESAQIQTLPLIGRDFVYLQELEPGVVSASDRMGTSGPPAFGTNGAQTQFNVYLIDGTDTGDIALNVPSFIASVDAISEFRMVTSTVNPEYARSSGAIMNAIIKSGTNSFHGDAFEFYRDTFLDAANFFAVPHVASPFHQNEFGGTIGGPVVKNHLFFFFSYQGVREVEPQTNPIGPNVVTNVYSPAELAGNFGTAALANTTNPSPFPLWGTPCPPPGPKCPAGTTYGALFPTGVIPPQDFSSFSMGLVQKYVPPANFGTSEYSFNASQPGKDDQYIARIDETISSKDTLWGTWFQESFPVSDSVPFDGATLPGFGMEEQQHWKMLTLSWTHAFNDHMVNELRGGWDRFNFASVYPQTPTLPSAVGFNNINPQDPSGAGMPVMTVTGLFTLGFSADGPQPRIDSVYQATDNFTYVREKHTFKVGFDMRRWEVDGFFLYQNDGQFIFADSGAYSTGDAGADFLLGIPASYAQASGGLETNRARMYYSYIQDEFKLRPNLTLTYGMGFSVDSPMINLAFNGHAQIAFRPGQQSMLYPGAPLGVVYQGDPGVNAAGKTRLYLGPRVGFAYSPDWGWISGGPGRMSIRAGFGLYYNRSSQEEDLQVTGVPPFAIDTALGGTTSVFNPGFPNPFAAINAGGGSQPNPYPFTGFPSNVNFATTPGLEPVIGACCAVLDANTQDPKSANYNLTLERQLSSALILSIGYVGAESRHLTYGLPYNIVTDSAGDTRYPVGVYGSIDTLYSGANGNYNALQVTLNQHLSKRMTYLAAYTYSHSIDDASGFENSAFGEVGGGYNGFGGFGAIRASNPYCFPGCDYASSINDARQRLVVSYTYEPYQAI